MNEEISVQSAELKQFVVDKVEDLKAKDIVVLEVTDKSNVTDYMVVCSGTSKTHVKAIAENVVLEAKRANLHIHGVEGRDSSEWVLVDLGDVIVHVMQDKTRDFYQLEKLWSEKPA
nr:ribosome silencing factor [Shewanella insulae]